MKVLIALLTFLLSLPTAATSLKDIVIFGDSLSDNGNLYEYMQRRLPISPPYYEGRFSNGPVWIEHLANYYFPHNSTNYLFDYAFGGAGIAEDPEDDDALFTLKHEMDSYFLSHENKASAESLFVVWIGANNYLAIPSDIEQSVHHVTSGITEGLERLARQGARYILVLNLPDLGKIPAAREFDAVEKLSIFAKRHNEMLAQSLLKLQKDFPEVQWISFDVDQLFNDIITSPAVYGITNITDSCYEAMTDEPSGQSILKMAARMKTHYKNKACDGYLFFDQVHSTVLIHQIFAERVKEVLDSLNINFSANIN